MAPPTGVEARVARQCAMLPRDAYCGIDRYVEHAGWWRHLILTMSLVSPWAGFRRITGDQPDSPFTFKMAVGSFGEGRSRVTNHERCKMHVPNTVLYVGVFSRASAKTS